MMNDLSHWDYADEFTAKEAALLIRGLDPNNSDIPDTDPVLRRLRNAYESALLELQIHHDSSLDTHDPEERLAWLETLDPTYLHCTAMTITDESLYYEWMYRRLGENLNAQKFSRTELVRWLTVTGWKSKYQFDYRVTPTNDVATANSEPDQKIPNRPLPKVEVRAKRLIELAKTLGYEVPNLPARKGNDPGPKQKIVEKALRELSLFHSKDCIKQAWEFASKNRWLLDGGLLKE